MRKLSSLAAIRQKLTELRGPNIAHWVQTAKILQGRSLILKIEGVKIADFKGTDGPKTLRETIERFNLPLPVLQKIFETIADLWCREPFAGELRVDEIAKKADGAENMAAVITAGLKDQKTEPPAAAPPIITPPIAPPTAKPEKALTPGRKKSDLIDPQRQGDEFSFAAAAQTKLAKLTGRPEDKLRVIAYWTEALQCYKLARKAKPAVFAISYLAEAEKAAGEATGDIGLLRSSIARYKEAIRLFNRLGLEERAAFGHLMSGFAHSFISRLLTGGGKDGRPEMELAIDSFNSALIDFETAGLFLEAVRATSHASGCHLELKTLRGLRAATNLQCEAVRLCLDHDLGRAELVTHLYYAARNALRLADATRNPDDYHEARGHCLSLIEALSAPEGQSRALFNAYNDLIQVQAKIADLTKGPAEYQLYLDYAQTARRAIAGLGEACPEAPFLTHEGKARQGLSDQRMAIGAFEQAETILSDQKKDNFQRAYNLFKLAFAYYDLAKQTDGRSDFRRAADTVTAAIGLKSFSYLQFGQIAKAHHLRAKIGMKSARTTADYKAVLADAPTAADFSGRTGRRDKKAEQLNLAARAQGAIARLTDDPQQRSRAAALTLKTAALYAELGRENMAAHLFSHTGEHLYYAARAAGDIDGFKKAIEYKSRAAVHFEKTGQTEYRAYCYDYIGHAWLKLAELRGSIADLSLGLETIRQAERLFGRLSNPFPHLIY